MQEHGDRQEDQAEQEVGHHQTGGQVRLHHQGAQSHLGDQTQHQPPGEHSQIATAGRPQPGRRKGAKRRHRDDGVDQPVAELHPGVELQGCHDPGRGAVGPVGAAQTRACQAHGRPGDNRQHQGPHCGQGDAPKGARRDPPTPPTPPVAAVAAVAPGARVAPSAPTAPLTPVGQLRQLRQLGRPGSPVTTLIEPHAMAAPAEAPRRDGEGPPFSVLPPVPATVRRVSEQRHPPEGRARNRSVASAPGSLRCAGCVHAWLPIATPVRGGDAREPGSGRTGPPFAAGDYSGARCGRRARPRCPGRIGAASAASAGQSAGQSTRATRADFYPSAVHRAADSGRPRPVTAPNSGVAPRGALLAKPLSP